MLIGWFSSYVGVSVHQYCRWGQRHYVFGLFVHLCVGTYVYAYMHLGMHSVMVCLQLLFQF